LVAFSDDDCVRDVGCGTGSFYRSPRRTFAALISAASGRHTATTRRYRAPGRTWGFRSSLSETVTAAARRLVEVNAASFFWPVLNTTLRVFPTREAVDASS
jgi:hypothetical protein